MDNTNRNRAHADRLICRLPYTHNPHKGRGTSTPRCGKPAHAACIPFASRCICGARTSDSGDSKVGQLESAAVYLSVTLPLSLSTAVIVHSLTLEFVIIYPVPRFITPLLRLGIAWFLSVEQHYLYLLGPLAIVVVLSLSFYCSRWIMFNPSRRLDFQLKQRA